MTNLIVRKGWERMENTLQMDIVEGKKPSAFKRFLLVLLITAVLLGGAVYAAGYILFNGPSAYAKQQFVVSVQEHSVLRLVPKLYLTDGEIAAILTAEDADGQFSVFPNAG